MPPSAAFPRLPPLSFLLSSDVSSSSADASPPAGSVSQRSVLRTLLCPGTLVVGRATAVAVGGTAAAASTAAASAEVSVAVDAAYSLDSGDGDGSDGRAAPAAVAPLRASAANAGGCLSRLLVRGVVPWAEARGASVPSVGDVVAAVVVVVDSEGGSGGGGGGRHLLLSASPQDLPSSHRDTVPLGLVGEVESEVLRAADDAAAGSCSGGGGGGGALRPLWWLNDTFDEADRAALLSRYFEDAVAEAAQAAADPRGYEPMAAALGVPAEVVTSTAASATSGAGPKYAELRGRQHRRHAAALVAEGAALTRAKRHAEAVELFEEARRHDPRSADALVGLGATLANTGRLDAAAARFEEALKVNPQHPNARTYLAATEHKLQAARRRREEGFEAGGVAGEGGSG
eukprot:Rhum_TRINITY_DN10172_c0_g1::Rhum_TRINITY_DN10172_c0_g1_i1::g.37118::m.37118